MTCAAIIKTMGDLLMKTKESVDAISTKDLRELAQMESIGHEMSYLAKSLEGIACLVASDGQRESGCAAGNFQHHTDVSELLLHISSTIAAQAECAIIANGATYLLEQRAAASAGAAAK
jgi:hypothetical protein